MLEQMEVDLILTRNSSVWRDGPRLIVTWNGPHQLGS